MYEYKLQIGCLVAVLYFIASYIRAGFSGKLECEKSYDFLLIIAPWAIIFDGITAWTVNHMDIVSDGVNRILHLLFLVSEDLVIICVFVYIIKKTIGIRSKKRLTIMLIPGLISLITIIFSIKGIYYVDGKTSRYSMGTSVYACYISLLFHAVLIMICLLYHQKTIEKRKVLSIYGFFGMILLILAIQVIIPESLISSLFPMLAVMGIYIIFENPSLKRLEMYNAEIIASFATLVESRDDSTGEHIKRTRDYVNIILEHMSKNKEYNSMLSKDYTMNVLKAAPMHDIGKISTPDNILQKPGKLTAEEFEIMKEHAQNGGEIIKEILAKLEDDECLNITYEVAKYHHEKWNGKGYPEGLQGEEIPLHARIMTIADVFDAVSANRCYRAAMPIEECFEIIENGAGSDFDPKLVECFLEAKEEILSYYNEH